MKVSYDDIYLHSVDVNQFVDSPEYDNSAAADLEELFQVKEYLVGVFFVLVVCLNLFLHVCIRVTNFGNRTGHALLS